MLSYKMDVLPCSPIFFANTAQHIEQQAARGWMITKVGLGLAIYELQQPKQILCQVVPIGSSLFMKKGKEEHQAFCQQWLDAGWTCIGSHKEYQIFITDDTTALDFRYDTKAVFRQLINRSSISGTFIILLSIFLVFTGIQVKQVVTIRLLLTSNVTLGLIVLMGMTLANLWIRWMMYRYWCRNNRDWLEDSDNSGEPYLFSKQIMLCLRIVKVVTIGLIGVSVCVIVTSVPLHQLFLGSRIGLISLLIGRLMQKGIDIEKDSKKITVILVIVFILAVVPWRYITEPLRNKELADLNQNEVLLLADFAIARVPTHVDYRPMKSVFTKKQINYSEYHYGEYVETSHYEFRHPAFLRWYVASLLEGKQITPFPEIQGRKGNYLSADKKSLYLMEGNSIYIVSSSLSLEEDELTIIDTKIFRTE